MTGMRWFISSSPVPPAATSSRTPTLQRIVRDYLSGFATAGCEYVVSTAQREQLGRLLSGFYASSVATAPGCGCGVSVGKAARWTKYRVQIECVREGEATEMYDIAFGPELLSRLHGLHPWWLNAVGGHGDAWLLVYKLFAGAVPAGTAFVTRWGATLIVEVERNRRARVWADPRRPRPRRDGRRAGARGVPPRRAVCTLIVALEGVARVQMRATVGSQVRLTDSAIPAAERTELARQAAAHHDANGVGQRIRVAFPIRVLAAEDVEYDGSESE
jgi:hypothetical protein